VDDDCSLLDLLVRGDDKCFQYDKKKEAWNGIHHPLQAKEKDL
jgi:hypothetical protein